MEQLYDVIIVGAGPIGICCGIEAVNNNLSHIIIEKGCIVNSIYNYPTNMTFFSTSDKIEIGNIPFVSHGDKPTRREALEYYRRTAIAYNLNLALYARVTFVDKKDGIFYVSTNNGIYTSKNLIFASGFYDNPNLMNIEGEDLPKVKHYFEDAHPYAFFNIAVIGGGNSAVDTALECFRKGASVTLVVKENRLKSNVKYWVKPDIENRIKDGSINAFFNSEIIRISESSITIKSGYQHFTIENDFVFAMTGYHSDFELLENSGIEISKEKCRTPCFNSTTFETNVENLYLAGVVLSGMDTSKWFIENTRFLVKNIYQSILKKIELVKT